jgi:hypothetical protein
MFSGKSASMRNLGNAELDSPTSVSDRTRTSSNRRSLLLGNKSNSLSKLRDRLTMSSKGSNGRQKSERSLKITQEETVAILLAQELDCLDI